MNSLHISAAIRKPAQWLALALVLGFVAFRVKFVATPVQVFDVKRGMAIGEVMRTGTLEARVKSTKLPLRLRPTAVSDASNATRP